MNVRMEEQNLRFKITEEELKILLSGRCLHMKIRLMDKILVVTVNPEGLGHDMEAKLVLDQSDAYLNLLIPIEKVQALSNMGRSREGLKTSVDGLSLLLQVDLRSDKRKAKRA